MAINKRLIAGAPTGGGGACTTDTLQILGGSSCIAYYKMADATDESGSYNGTPTSVNFNAEGKYGLAGKFNGSSSIINLGDHNVFSPSVNPLSFSLWIKKSTSSFNTIFSKGASGSYEYALFISGSGVIQLQASNLSFSSNVNISTSASYSDGNWHHVVAIYDPSGNFKIYVDGTQQATSSSSFTMGNSSNALHIGRKYENNVDILDGSLDQFRVFNKAVSASEVSTLYNEVQCATAVTPSEHFNTVLYDGNNASSRSITGVGFEPSFNWIKARDNGGNNHLWTDSIRGVGVTSGVIGSNLQSVTNNNFGHISAFGSDGFTVAQGSVSINYVNSSNAKYASWNWYAPTSETNTSGTITSTIKKNIDAGFSIVSYTTQSSGTATVGHGLSALPDMIIVKTTGVADSWRIYNSSLGADKQIFLNETSAAGSTANQWNNTSPTDSVFSLGTDNVGSYTTIAYCFHSVEGYSRIGSYVSNGSLQFTATGFEPAFLMIKKTNGTGSWIMVDNKRDTLNPRTKFLTADDEASEVDASSVDIDFFTNGFSTNGSNSDINNGNYIFMAFAQDPDTTPATEADSFNTLLYTGNGANSRSITGVGFKPDWTWIKKRGPSTANHLLQNTVFGAGTMKGLASNDTSTAGNYDQYGYISAFGSNGFTLQEGTDASYSNDNANENNSTYVAWNWKAADHDRSLATINQDGSISSLVSANKAAGFSIVKYTGNQTAGASVGHGLGVAPKMVILKNITRSGFGWLVYHEAISPNAAIVLNSTDAKATDIAFFNNTATTTTTFTLGSDTFGNSNDYPYIGYCFADIASYQKVGSYTGNGNDAGTIVDTGFTPQFVMIKSSSSNDNGGGSWLMYDNVRSTSNPRNKRLYADLAEKEATNSQYDLDFLTGATKGFQPKNGDSGGWGYNTLNVEYIYLAIA